MPATAEQLIIEASSKLEKAFTPHRPINLPEFFAGRLKLRYRTVDAANTPGVHVILYGDPGTGKTSIARVLAYDVQERDRPNGRRAILISCTSNDDYRSIWRKTSQEILLGQRQMGFVQQSVVPITGRLDVADSISGPNDARLFVQSLPNPSCIIIDEFDRISDPGTKREMADTIKMFSDSSVDSTLVIVGVADNVADLFAQHQSIARNTAQLKVEPMRSDELAEIIQKGFGRAGLTYDSGIAERIAHLSQGYPHYTHLLGLWCGRRALEDERLNVIAADLENAIPDALENATGGVQHEYERAVASSRPNTLYREVLLACALAQKDSLGRFSAIDARKPLRIITAHGYDTGAYQSHLAKFCEEERGPVLKKSGKRRSYKWQFVNPQLIPYVLLEGRRDKRLAWMDALNGSSSGPQPPSVLSPDDVQA